LLFWCGTKAVDCASPGSDSPYVTRADPSQPTRASASIGQTGTVVSGSGGGSYYGFAAKEDLDAMVKADAVGNHVGLRQAILRGIRLEPGTRVLVIDASWTGAKQIRFIDGPKAAQTVWTLKEAIGA